MILILLIIAICIGACAYGITRALTHTADSLSKPLSRGWGTRWSEPHD